MKRALTVIALLACLVTKPTSTTALDVDIMPLLAKAYILGMEEQRLYGRDDLNVLRIHTIEDVEEMVR